MDVDVAVAEYVRLGLEAQVDVDGRFAPALEHRRCPAPQIDACAGACDESEPVRDLAMRGGSTGGRMLSGAREAHHASDERVVAAVRPAAAA